ncbi:MAG: hypothetical protein ACE5HY_03620 [Candidatus Hydrothermarchaeales archaeon]
MRESMDPALLFNLNIVTGLKVLLLMVVLVSLFLWFGALASGIPNITPTNIVTTAAAAIGAQWLVAIILSSIPYIGGLLGFIFSLLAMIYVFRYFFNITWQTALIVFFLTILAEVSAAMVIKLFLRVDIWAFARTFIFVV